MANSNEFSAATKALIFDRDRGLCALCGEPVSEVWPGYSFHHRRSRRIKDAQTATAANGVLLDGSGSTGCHEYVHAHPTESLNRGFIVSQWATPVRTWIEHAVLGDVFLDLDGGWTPATEPEAS